MVAKHCFLTDVGVKLFLKFVSKRKSEQQIYTDFCDLEKMQLAEGSVY